MSINVKEQKISDTADLIQAEMHKCIESVMEKKQSKQIVDSIISVNTKGEIIVGGKLLYQDVANVFLIRKLAELTNENSELRYELKQMKEQLNHHINNHVNNYNGNIK